MTRAADVVFGALVDGFEKRSELIGARVIAASPAGGLTLWPRGQRVYLEKKKQAPASLCPDPGLGLPLEGRLPVVTLGDREVKGFGLEKNKRALVSPGGARIWVVLESEAAHLGSNTAD